MDLPATQDQGPPSTPPSLRRDVLQAAINLFGFEEVNPRLEFILKNQGVNYAAIIDRTGPICLRRISIDEGSGSFEFDDELGEPTFTLAVNHVDAETVIDLIGWPIWRPESFCTYFRRAGLLGGDAAVNPASFVESPCPIWATPLAWLQSGLRGCVVVDPRLAAPILRQAPGRFQCEDEVQAGWLVETGAVALSELLVPARRAFG
jgi:hypothetical protein